jgi:hypothetical protein
MASEKARAFKEVSHIKSIVDVLKRDWFNLDRLLVPTP